MLVRSVSQFYLSMASFLRLRTTLLLHIFRRRWLAVFLYLPPQFFEVLFQIQISLRRVVLGALFAAEQGAQCSAPRAPTPPPVVTGGLGRIGVQICTNHSFFVLGAAILTADLQIRRFYIRLGFT